MSVPSDTPRIAGPFAGDGVTVTFAFTFLVFAALDLVVTQADAYGSETVLTLTADYTVALNADQTSTPGGSVTLLVAPPVNYTLALTSAVSATQDVSLTTGGGFYPSVISTALDRLTVLAQQLKEKISRAVMVDVTSNVVPSNLMAQLSADASQAATSAANASASETAAAGSAVSAESSLTSFTDQYQGAFGAAPVTRPDSSALQSGDLYFDTGTNLLMIYDGAAWVNAGNSLTPNQIVALAGGATQPLNVVNATAATEAVNLGQANADYAALAGNSAQTFQVANAATATEAVPSGQSLGGIGYAWVDETASRVAGTTYTNLTGRPIQVIVSVNSALNGGAILIVNGANLYFSGGPAQDAAFTSTLMPLDTYQLVNGGGTVYAWYELK